MTRDAEPTPPQARPGAEAGRVRVAVRVEGIVQGVGFRPFVHALATGLGLGGFVGNDARGVFVEVEGPPAAVERFLLFLERDAPALAVIEAVVRQELPPTGQAAFAIVASEQGGERSALISPDTATCHDCLREMLDPSDRRYRYAFTNCTNCGPRFTIVRDVPYDRPCTTMAGFPMCPDCAREYHDPSDRRFHAQPVCCPACGPRLRLLGRGLAPVEGDPLAEAARLLAGGAIVAVKGLGGYHLAVDAGDDAAASELRSRKRREDKPFAVMVRDVGAARTLAVLSPAEEELLSSARRPIVLLRARPDAPVAEAVAPGNRFLGLMLPYTPLHHLLAAELGRPFVLTSGNVSDEPIAYRDDDALERLGGIADAFLVHDRAIHVRTDDSVARVFAERPMLLRRSRGYAPQPVPIREAPRPVLAVGGELKNTFCLAKGRRAFVSHHVGDLENYETLRSFTEGIEHFERLFDVRPEVVAHDLHPEYLSTKHALALDGVELARVQHHHAHVASCLADNGEEGPAIGVAFDGLGFGTDGTMWGGELLVATLAGFERVGWFDPVPMPGGAAAVREPWRMAAVYLREAFGGAAPPGLEVVRRNEDRWAAVLEVAGAGLNSPRTSSAGRLFDAVAAIVGVRDRITYEGQAAVELEQRADPNEEGTYPAGTVGEWPFRIRGADLVRAAVEDLAAGTGAEVVAARFHNAVADALVRACERIREGTGLATVAFSGGVFQNLLLLRRAVAAVEARGFRVLLHSRVPPNDGGISLGQAAVAGALDRARTNGGPPA